MKREHTVEIGLSGFLTEEGLRRHLDQLRPKGTPRRLLVDCQQMRGCEPKAKELFVAWNRDHRHVVDRVAVVSSNFIYRMMVSVMALRAEQTMRAFSDRDSALRWLRPSQAQPRAEDAEDAERRVRATAETEGVKNGGVS